MTDSANNDFIYALIEKDTKTKWYIGRTINPLRRLMEHRYGAKYYQPGDELKYQYANALDMAGIDWDMEILMECGPDTEFYEDFFINKFRNEPLMNMRGGDQEPWMGRDYSDPKEFVETRASILRKREMKNIKEIKAKKLDADVSTTKFFGDFGKKAKLSPALQEILDKRGLKR